MNSIQIFLSALCILSLSRSTKATYVSDLKPDTDCPAIMAQKAEERAQNPALVKTFNRFGSKYSKKKNHKKSSIN